MSTSKNKPARAVSDAVLLSIAAGVALGVSIAVGREQGDWAGVAVFGPLLGAAFTALLLLHRTVLTALAVVAVLASMAAADAPLRTTLAAPSAPQTNLCVSQFPLPGCYATIQAAIDAAAPGDMIRVATGMYTETLVITKTLVLKGGYAHRPTFDLRRPLASALTGNIYIAGSVDVTVSGFTLRGRMALFNGAQAIVQDMDMSAPGLGFTVCPSCTAVVQNVAADSYDTLFTGGGAVEARHLTVRNIGTLAENVSLDLRHSIISDVYEGLYTFATVTETNTLRHATGPILLSTVSASGVITGNPKFVSGWHIGPDSPAIDAAVSSTMLNDAEGHDRPQGSGRDLGADEMKARDARVLPYSQATLILPGQSVYLPVRVQNTGTQTETLTLTSSGAPAGWSAVPAAGSVGPLGPWMSATVDYIVTAPAGALYGEEAEVWLTPSSPGISAEAGMVRLRVAQTGGLVIGPEDALAASPVITVPRGTTLTATHRLTNTSNYTDSIALSALSTWPVSALPISLTLGPGASAPISLVITASGAITQRIAPVTLLAAGQYASATVTHTLWTSATVYLPFVHLPELADGYEPDNSCDQFSTISVGETQTRTFDLLGPVSMTDTDIVKVTFALGGTYTLTARSTQTNATPHMALIPGACNGAVWQTVNDSDFVFIAPSDNYVMWLRITNNSGKHGSDTQYRLAVSNKIADMMALWAEPPAVAPPQ